MQFKARFEAIAAVGTLRTPEMGRWIEGSGKPKIFEIKVDHGPGYRLYAIRHGKDWFVTHGSKKPKDRRVAHEAERARDIYGTGGGK
jgi:putative component of toxin-antitoxin plasmid stabilization module